MGTTRRGREAERHAERWLKARGLQVLARNYRCRFGELDLVMRQGDTLVFVEVRLRRDERFGGADAVTGVYVDVVAGTGQTPANRGADVAAAAGHQRPDRRAHGRSARANAPKTIPARPVSNSCSALVMVNA